MKYDKKGTELLKPEQAQTQKFGIKDPAMLIEILRDKLYSNKVRVICQEYLSNGRDAHREIGKPDVPLKVSLPSSTKPQIEFRDFGPGITPERMSDVFCFFGESTKRKSNNQTGGFGIGAKSAWSYSEQFGVMTYVDGILRHYSMAIDETRTGEMILLHTEPTTEPNGTKIIIPVKNQDFRTFEEWTYRTTQWWDVKPEVIGKNGYSGWVKNHNIIKSGNDWKLVATSFGYNNEGGKPIAVVDGIEYPIIMDNIEDLDPECKNILKHNIYIFFKTGELEVAANREQLDYIRKTQSIIRLKCKEILETLKSQLKQDISKAKDLWDARIMWDTIVSSSDLKHIVKSVEWTAPDGKKIFVNAVGVDFKFDSNKIKIEYHNAFIDNSGVIRRKQDYRRGVDFISSKPIIINDSESLPSIARLTSLYKNYPTTTQFQCITINPAAGTPAKDLPELVTKFIKENNIIYMPHTVMSTVPRFKIPRDPNTKKQKVKSEKYNVYVIPNDHMHKSYPKEDVDLSEAEGYYVEFEHGYFSLGKGKHYVNDVHEYFAAVFKLLGINPTKETQKVYAIPVRFMNKIPSTCKLKKLNDEVNNKLDDMMKNSKVSLIELAFMESYIEEWSNPLKSSFFDITKNKDKFDDKDNMLLRLFEKIEDVKSMIASIKPWINAQKKVNVLNYGKFTYDRWSNKNPVIPDLWVELNNQKKELFNHMPLIEFINTNHNRSDIPKVINYVIDYANLCHKRSEELKSKVSLAKTQI